MALASVLKVSNLGYAGVPFKGNKGDIGLYRGYTGEYIGFRV